MTERRPTIDEATLRAALTEQPRGGHLDDDTWERLACGELDESERLLAIEHVTSCEECDRIYRALDVLSKEARAIHPDLPSLAPLLDETSDAAASFPTRGEADPDLPDETRPGFPGRYAWWAAAAAALFVVVVAGPWSTGERSTTVPPPLDGSTSDPLVVRSPPGEATTAEPVPLEPFGPISSPPRRLRWSAVAGEPTTGWRSTTRAASCSGPARTSEEPRSSGRGRPSTPTRAGSSGE